MLRGARQAHHQVIACADCGRKVFVLPSSPFDQPVEPTSSARPPMWRSWRAPLLAGGVCTALVLVGFALMLPSLPRRPKDENPSEGRPELPDLVSRIDAGRTALAQGKFHMGHRLLTEAVELRAQWPGQLSSSQNTDLIQLHRQARLLSVLSARSVEEMIRHGRLVRDAEEWKAQFADYRGRGIIFDDIVRLEDSVPVLINHVIEVDDEIVRVALADLKVLGDLPLDGGIRVVFGAQLASCMREEGGRWVLRFEPESGVLLTDLGAVEACFLTPVNNDLRLTIERQRRWVEERALLSILGN
jgi:hypothetical protein